MSKNTTKKARLPKATEFIKDGLALTHKQFKLLMKYVLPMAGLFILYMGFGLLSEENLAFAGLAALTYAALIVYSVYFGIVFPRIMFQLQEGKKINKEYTNNRIFMTFILSIGLGFITMIVALPLFYLFIVPGVIVTLMYANAKMVLILEGKGVHQSIADSVQLASGKKWNMFGVYFFSALFVGIPLAVGAGVIAAIFGAIGIEWLAAVAIGIYAIAAMLYAIPLMQYITVRMYRELKARLK